MDTLPSRLGWARKLAGLSSREVDRLAGLTLGHAHLIESGRRPRIEVETAQGLARVFGTSIDWLASGLGTAPSEQQIADAVSRARAAFALEHDDTIVDTIPAPAPEAR